MTKTYTPQQFLEFYTFLPKITDSLPTADENKRQYPIDFMLERRISHNPQASSPHVIHEQLMQTTNNLTICSRLKNNSQ